jgi:hypothetical protein
MIGKAVEKVEELLSYGGRDPTGWRSAPIEVIKGRTGRAPDGPVSPGYVAPAQPPRAPSSRPVVCYENNAKLACACDEGAPD